MTLRHLAAAALVAAAPLALPGAALRAQQSPAEHVALGDKSRDADPTAALAHYEAALKADPNNYDALSRGAYSAVEAGKLSGDKERRQQLYQTGETLARRAVQVRPADAEGHFALAAAVGRRAQTMGSRDRVKFAGEVHKHASEALKYNPRHGGALHVMGMWNAEVMRLNGVSRFMAKNLLGGRVFDQASWDNAQSYMERAVQAEPNRLTHRVDLAAVYLDRGNTARAKEQIDFVAAAPAREAGDAQFKREAEALRARM